MNCKTSLPIISDSYQFHVRYRSSRETSVLMFTHITFWSLLPSETFDSTYVPDRTPGLYSRRNLLRGPPVSGPCSDRARTAVDADAAAAVRCVCLLSAHCQGRLGAVEQKTRDTLTPAQIQSLPAQLRVKGVKRHLWWTVRKALEGKTEVSFSFCTELVNVRN